MKKYNILYDWPIDEIARLCVSDEAESFAFSLGEGSRQDEFIRLTEQMLKLSDDLKKASADRRLFTQWIDLRLCVETFEREFSSFPEAQLKKFRLSLLIADNLAQSVAAASGGADDLDEHDVDEKLFELRSLSVELPIIWFVHQNAQSFNDSIVVFSCGDLVGLETKINESTIAPELSYQVLATLYATANVPEPVSVLVKKQCPPIGDAAIDAFVRLVILASGQAVHRPKSYVLPPRVIDRDCIRAGTPYHQLNDVIYVLSEYNSRQEVLTKYLTLYHVIENFMFKLPIVELEHQQGGRMFSIRDFKRLYKQIDDSELSSLKRLFSVTLQVQAMSGNTFEQHIIDRWNSLVPGVATADIEKALGALDIKKDKRPLKHSEFSGGAVEYFAKLVYAIRNAIVHNKETEFHLSYATLDATLCVLLELFLLPSLEELCFALVGGPNPHVWYQNNALVLY
jgi:hypothetical protein